MTGAVRLNKFLVESGVCSRRAADRFISAGNVLVNGQPATLGQKVNGSEEIIVNGQPILKREITPVYLAYHKPVGVICTADPEAQGNIIQAVNYPERVFTVGRLDVGSSGLILLTNNGEVANQITRAEGQHEKEYEVVIHQLVTPQFLQAMAEGVKILDRKTMPAQVKQIDLHSFGITLVEGRNRQIRRMCSALGTTVKALKRVRVMNVHLGDLPVRQWRHLTQGEEKELLLHLQ